MPPRDDDPLMKVDPSNRKQTNGGLSESACELLFETSWRSIRSTLLPTLQESACRNLIDRLLRVTAIPLQSNDETIGNDDTAITNRLGGTDESPDKLLGNLGPYTLRHMIGMGGMSTVFEARDERLGRQVAIKIQSGVRLDQPNKARFAREAQSQATVSHPAILPIYDVSVTSTGIPYLVTELATAGTWRDYLTRISSEHSQQFKTLEDSFDGQSSFRLVAEVIARIADGLSVAHAAGIVHRDIKPSNILLCELPAGSLFQTTDSSQESSECFKLGWLPKLADFGLARPIEEAIQLTHSSILSGTPAYMSPEQIVTPDKVTPSTDIYSLGITLYESLTGELPFRGTPHAILRQIAQDEPRRPSQFRSEVPNDLEWICMKAISHSPDDRYKSAGDFAEDLRNWLGGRPINAKPPSLLGVFSRWCRRNPRVAILSGSVFALMLLLTIGSLSASMIMLKSKRDLEVSTAEAKEATEKAMAFADAANQQKLITLDTLNDLVGRVQTQLAKRPDTTQIRADLLNTAFEGLERATRQGDSRLIESKDASYRTIVEAHIKMSGIKLDQGDRLAAIKHAQEAVALAKNAMEFESEDVERWRILANALTSEFELHLTSFANEQAERTAEKLIDVRRKVLEFVPNDAMSLRALVAAKQRLADQYRLQGKLDDSLAAFRDLLVDLSRMDSLPDPIDIRRDRMILLSRVGMLCSQLNRIAEAQDTFHEAISLNRQLLDEDRSNVLFRNDKAFLLARLSLVFSASKRHSDATKIATEALHEYEKLAADDPNRVQSHTLVGTAHDLLYQVYFAQGDMESALKSEIKSYDTALQVHEMDRDTSRHLQLASEAASRIADLYLRGGELEQSREWAGTSYEKLQQARDKVDFDPSSSALQIQTRRVFWQAMQLVSQGEQASRASLEANPASSRVALATLAYDRAKHSELEDAHKLLKELITYPALDSIDQAQLDCIILRGLALCIVSLEAPEQKELAQQITFLTDRAIAAIPQLRSSFQVDPDFEPFRQMDLLRSRFQ